MIKEEMQKEYMINLRNFVGEERKTKIIYPDSSDLFKVFDLHYNDIHVVIAGNEPYCDGLSDGLAFSSKGERTPILYAIFEAISTDWYRSKYKHVTSAFKTNELKCWLEQGVFLYNTILTVEKDKPNSHRKKGWEQFTRKVYELLNNREKPIVFMFWGKSQELASLITNPKHLVLKSLTPVNEKHFSKAAQFVFDVNNVKINGKDLKQVAMDWRTF
jgi:uracil-DNA glycosylase